jgi:hypothetical protein
MIRQCSAIAAASLLTMSAAQADRAAGDDCARGLPPPSQQIYAATVAVKPHPDAARDVVVAETKKMIRSGALSPLKARSAAKAAGRCLALIVK